LIRAGNLYLSLQDAISLSLENNLDIQLQRYNPLIAATDTKRAKGGGLLRGLVYTVNELPQGIGGPGSPLLTTVGGAAPATQISANSADLAVITESQNNLLILSPIASATGTAVPAFDPAVTTNVNYQHLSQLQNTLLGQGTSNLVSGIETGTAGYQQGFSTGATLSANYFMQRTDYNSFRSDYDPFMTGSLGLQFTQPLLRGFGIDLNRRFIHIAENQEKISKLIFNQQLIDTISSVVRLYWDLVALVADVKVKEQAVAAAQKLYDNNKSQVEVGTLAPLQLTQAAAEVARTKQDLINSHSLVAQQELILKNVITKSGADDPAMGAIHLIPVDSIQIPKDDQLEGIDGLIAEAFRNRPDLAQAEIAIENSNLALKGSKNALLPQLDIVGGATNNAFAGTVNPLPPTSAVVSRAPDPALLGGFGTLWQQILQRNYPSYQLGLQLTIPLRNRVAQADVARDQLQVRQSEVRLRQTQNQVRVEVQNALLSLQRARASYDAAVETRRLQEEALDAEQQRFAVGQSTSFQVIQFERDLAQARSSEVIASDEYAKARAALDRSMGRTLAANNISLDEAFSGSVSRPHTPLPPEAK
jgi:outer membrane protein TolC